MDLEAGASDAVGQRGQKEENFLKQEATDPKWTVRLMMRGVSEWQMVTRRKKRGEEDKENETRREKEED